MNASYLDHYVFSFIYCCNSDLLHRLEFPGPADNMQLSTMSGADTDPVNKLTSE